MKKVVILGNDFTSKATDRTELVEMLKKQGMKVYCGRIYDGAINEYYTEETATCLPIIASRSNTNPFVELRSMNSVRKTVKSNGLDAAIIYGVKNHAAMAVGAKFGGAKRVLCVVNGSGNLFRIKGFKGWLLRVVSFPMLRLAYKRSDAVCFQNEEDKELFIKKRLVADNDKVFVTCGSGVNLKKFKKQELVQENRFLYLSRITVTKGILEYVKAAEIVKKKYPDTIFDIVGFFDSAVEKSMKDFIQSSIDAGTVVYHGATDDVASWMAKCKFFVYPSYYPEGVPRCAIQAIASGRPIITCNTQGCKDTVRDGINGFLVPPKDVEALAEKMIWMIENPESISKMANASRELAELKFDVDDINRKLMDRLNW